tara:strand:+ start:5622 stop:5813 length:192 start_codon:yes stop_codon:yes gene_type:complete
MPIINICSGESDNPSITNQLKVSVGDVAIDHVKSIDIHKIEPENIVTATIVCAVTLGNGEGEG